MPFPSANCHAGNVWRENWQKRRRSKMLERHFGESCTLDNRPCLAVRMTSHSEVNEQWPEPVLQTPQPRSSRRGHMLDEHKMCPGLEHAMNFLEHSSNVSDRAKNQGGYAGIHAPIIHMRLLGIARAQLTLE